MTRKNLQVELINKARASQFDPGVAEVLPSSYLATSLKLNLTASRSSPASTDSI